MNYVEYKQNNEIFKALAFKKIETSDLAYAVGYLFGDGGYHKTLGNKGNRGYQNPTMYVSSVDKKLVVWMRDLFCPITSIQARLPINNKRPEIVSKQLSYIVRFPTKCNDSLVPFGVSTQKVNRQILNIPKKYMLPFILGLFDADGCVSWGFRKDRNRLWAHVQFTHSSEKVLNTLQQYFEKTLNIASSLKKRPTENCYNLTFADRFKVEVFIKALYKDTPSYYNKQKYNKAQKYLKNLLAL